MLRRGHAGSVVSTLGMHVFVVVEKLLGLAGQFEADCVHGAKDSFFRFQLTTYLN